MEDDLQKNNKRTRTLIPLEIKKNIYRDYRKNNIHIDELSKKYEINKKSIYAIVKKLSNDEEIQNLKTSTENDSPNKSSSVDNIDKKETIQEESKENILSSMLPISNNQIENNKENEKENDNETTNESENQHNNEDLIDFINKNKNDNINEEELQPLKLKRNDAIIKNEPIIEFKPIPILKKSTLNYEDFDIVTNNKIDTSDVDKNNYIVKIRKYYNYFEDDLKHIIDKKKINSLFKLKIEELKSIYELIKLEINTKSMNFESIAELGLTQIEKISSFLNLNLEGIKDDLMMNDIFIKNLKILEIENGDLLSVLSPKKLILLMFLKCCYTRYNINKMNDDLSKKIDIKVNPEIVKKYNKL